MKATARLGLRLILLAMLALPAVVQGQFMYTTNNGNITITKYTGSGGAVAIPDTINSLPVANVGNGAFSNCYALSSVTTPATASLTSETMRSPDAPT